MTSPIRDHVYRGDGGLCTFKPAGHDTVCDRERYRHDRIMVDGQMKITDHIYQGVMGHPDDDECTFRADGTDDTYCGRSRYQHADPGDGRPPARFDGLTLPVRAQALQRRLEMAVEGFFDRQLYFPETQEIQRLVERLTDADPALPPLCDQYIDATGARWTRARDYVLQALPKSPSGPLVGPHPFERRGWRFWICAHCYAPKSLHPRTGYVKARPLDDNHYIDHTAPHWDEGW